MKRMIRGILLFLISINLYAIDWSIDIAVNNKREKRVSLKDRKMSFKIKGMPWSCDISETTKEQENLYEFKILKCSNGDSSFFIDLVCLKKENFEDMRSGAIKYKNRKVVMALRCEN
jgi:hypothetical protein